MASVIHGQHRRQLDDGRRIERRRAALRRRDLFAERQGPRPHDLLQHGPGQGSANSRDLDR